MGVIRTFCITLLTLERRDFLTSSDCSGREDSRSSMGELRSACMGLLGPSDISIIASELARSFVDMVNGDRQLDPWQIKFGRPK